MRNNELYHHGIKGQKWGVRRYQNPDGSYTSAGRRRYGIGSTESIKTYRTSFNKASSMQDEADLKWRDVQSARKKMGKTALGRTIASARNKTSEAKKYNKMYKEWSSMQDAVDEQWRDAKHKYKDTGRNKISRVVNNVKYDSRIKNASKEYVKEYNKNSTSEYIKSGKKLHNSDGEDYYKLVDKIESSAVEKTVKSYTSRHNDVPINEVQSYLKKKNKNYIESRVLDNYMKG